MLCGCGRGKLDVRIIKLFFPLPEAKKTICESLFACLFSTIKCKILLPVSGLYHMSPLVTKSACLLMSPIRGKDLEGLRELDSSIQYFCRGNFWLKCRCCAWKIGSLFVLRNQSAWQKTEREEEACESFCTNSKSTFEHGPSCLLTPPTDLVPQFICD